MATTVVGNLRLTPKAKSIEIRLNTDTGTALFGYGELPALIDTLKKIRPPVAAAVTDEDDWRDLV